MTPSKLLKKLDSTKKVESFSFVSFVQPQLSKSSIEARLTDVPVLVGAELIDATVDQKNNKHLIYKIISPLSTVHDSYFSQLQDAGWQTETQYCDEKFVAVVAKKPHKNAVLIFEFCNGTWFSQAYTIVHIALTH